ncbi:ABC transporter substrate-binding protein [Paenibacillus endoradicis]|uniref:ABC transporter substrate-binding protein n=1 Tax=Paenibacillus endoradicis TaxID=2972487 RepID=UPI0021595DBC|nr:ABC transporter substrate-binding protein [Paenibacillus endoradicis]MCR8655726.1 ABC transporter substrate-binding protein [Paenibacillus endoradicis]MCR8658052.1 ABC transporter substrate-binding protein [Paenibacillus endoradicis]
MTSRIWKKRIVLLICLSLLLIVTSCSTSNRSANIPDDNLQVIQLEFWTPFSGGDNRFMTQLVNLFNEENSQIQVIQVNSRLDDYYSRLRTTILSGSAPDVAILHQTSLPQFVQNGYIENLEEPAKAVSLDWNTFNANILESTVYDEVPYAVPLDTHTLVLYYNKHYLEQAGLLDAQGEPLLNSGQSLESFLKVLKQKLPPSIAPLAQPGTRIDSVWLWWSLYNQIDGGGAFYNNDQTEAVINNDKALKALQYVHRLYNDGIIPPNINDAFKMFYDGQAAVLITGVWGTGAFEEAEKLDFGVIPLPVVFDHEAVWGDSHTLVIPTKHGMTNEKRNAALYFMKWLVEHGAKWAEAGHVPSKTSVVESPEYEVLPFRSDYAATANYVAYWPRHVMQWPIVEILIQEFEKMNYGQQTPEETLRQTQIKINDELKE